MCLLGASLGCVAGGVTLGCISLSLYAFDRHFVKLRLRKTHSMSTLALEISLLVVCENIHFVSTGAV